jgi:hypothetical protein
LSLPCGKAILMHEAEVADAHNVGIAEFLGKKMMRYGQPR